MRTARGGRVRMGNLASDSNSSSSGEGAGRGDATATATAADRAADAAAAAAVAGATMLGDGQAAADPAGSAVTARAIETDGAAGRRVSCGRGGGGRASGMETRARRGGMGVGGRRSGKSCNQRRERERESTKRRQSQEWREERQSLSRGGSADAQRPKSSASQPPLPPRPAAGCKPHAYGQQLTSASDSSSPSSLCSRRASVFASCSPAELWVRRRGSGGGPQADPPPPTKNLERRPPALPPCAPLPRVLVMESIAASQSAGDIRLGRWLKKGGWLQWAARLRMARARQ